MRTVTVRIDGPLDRLVENLTLQFGEKSAQWTAFSHESGHDVTALLTDDATDRDLAAAGVMLAAHNTLPVAINGSQIVAAGLGGTAFYCRIDGIGESEAPLQGGVALIDVSLPPGNYFVRISELVYPYRTGYITIEE